MTVSEDETILIYEYISDPNPDAVKSRAGAGRVYRVYRVYRRLTQTQSRTNCCNFLRYV